MILARALFQEGNSHKGAMKPISSSYSVQSSPHSRRSSLDPAHRIGHKHIMQKIGILTGCNPETPDAARLDGLAAAVAVFEEKNRKNDPIDFDRWLHREPGLCGGRMVIRGTRLEPRHIYARHQGGDDLAQIFLDYPEIEPEIVTIAYLWGWLHREQP